MRLHVAAAVASMTTLFAALSAFAAPRTFVASTGSDTNPCSISQPCRSFGIALTKTAPYGEIIVLDSAGYGPVTVSQPVTITAPPGIYAGISASNGTNGVTIVPPAKDAAVPPPDVILRGLTIAGGDYGVYAASVPGQSGIRLEIDRCTFRIELWRNRDDWRRFRKDHANADFALLDVGHRRARRRDRRHRPVRRVQ